MRATYELLTDMQHRLPKLLGMPPRVSVSFSGYADVLIVRVVWPAGLSNILKFERTYTGFEISRAVSPDAFVDAFIDKCKKHCEAVERHVAARSQRT